MRRKRKNRGLAEFNDGDQFILTAKAKAALAVDQPIGFKISPLGQSVVVGNFVPSPEAGTALEAEVPESTAEVDRCVNGNSLMMNNQEGTFPALSPILTRLMEIEWQYECRSLNSDFGGGE